MRETIDRRAYAKSSLIARPIVVSRPPVPTSGALAFGVRQLAAVCIIDWAAVTRAARNGTRGRRLIIGAGPPLNWAGTRAQLSPESRVRALSWRPGPPVHFLVSARSIGASVLACAGRPPLTRVRLGPSSAKIACGFRPAAQGQASAESCKLRAANSKLALAGFYLPLHRHSNDTQ